MSIMSDLYDTGRWILDSVMHPITSLLSFSVQRDYTTLGWVATSLGGDANMIYEDNGDSLLHRCKSVEMATLLKDAGAKTVTNHYQRTPLQTKIYNFHYALQFNGRGEFALAHFLLNMTTAEQLNKANKEEETTLSATLHAASSYGLHSYGDEYVKFIEALLDKGADPNIQDKEKDTPLRLVIRNIFAQPGDYASSISPYIKIAEKLIAKGARLDIADKDGNNILAAFNKTLERRDYGRQYYSLLNKLADLFLGKDAFSEANTRLVALAPEAPHYIAGGFDIGNYNMVHYAAGRCTASVLNLFVTPENVNTTDRRGCTPLYYAVTTGNLEAVKALLDKSATVTPNIIKAALSCKTGYYKFANPNATEIIKLLHAKAPLAIIDESIAKEYLKDSLNPNATELSPNQWYCKTPQGEITWGTTMLHFAAQFATAEAVNALLIKTGNVYNKDTYERTPLHHAAASGNLEVVKALLEVDADPNACDMFGLPPMYYAAHSTKNTQEIMLALKEKGADVNHEVFDSYYHHTRISLLHYTAMHGLAAAVKVLIENGANVEARDQAWAPIKEDTLDDKTIWRIGGRTPLHYAVLGNMPANIKALLAAGAKCVGDALGYLPQEYAAVMKSKRVVEALPPVPADWEPTALRLHKQREDKRKHKEALLHAEASELLALTKGAKAAAAAPAQASSARHRGDSL